MININLSGITFLPQDVINTALSDGFEIGHEVTIKQTDDSTELYQGDYSVRYKNIHIGWIPTIHTTMKYMNRSAKLKDSANYEKQAKRFEYVESIRGHIHTDLHRNKLIPKGKLERILYMDKNNNFHECGEGDTNRKIAGIEVSFNYPHP